MTRFRILRSLLPGIVLGLALLVSAQAGAAASAAPRVALETSLGRIVVELTPERTPVTTENFLRYVREGFYDGTIFHRVIRGFMIQGGGFDERFRRKPTHPPIENEARHALPNRRGTIAMARTSNPHSATAQFFINTVDNPHLDYHGSTATTWGYAVFGRVVEGMDVVERIESLPTGAGGPFRRDVPSPRVVIEKATILER